VTTKQSIKIFLFFLSTHILIMTTQKGNLSSSAYLIYILSTAKNLHCYIGSRIYASYTESCFSSAAL